MDRRTDRALGILNGDICPECHAKVNGHYFQALPGLESFHCYNKMMSHRNGQKEYHFPKCSRGKR